MDQMDEIVTEFLVESYENLDQLDRDLVALEESPNDRECLSSIFRTIHTIKGTSGFLAFHKLEKVTHVGENLLVPLRDGELELSRDIADSLLAMVDSVRGILGNIESSGREGEDDYTPLIAKLSELKTGKPATPEVAPEPEPEPTTVAAESIAPEAPVVEEVPSQVQFFGTPKPIINTGDAPAKNPAKNPAQEQLAEQKLKEVEVSSEKIPHPSESVESELVANLPSAEELEELAKIALAATSSASAIPEVESQSPTEKPEKTEGAKRSQSVADSTVRIDVHLIDRLMNLVGELVLARNQILQESKSSEDPTIIAASQRLNHITTELQDGVMKMRMQPIRNVWNKLPRVVRDLSQACDKEIQVQMEGAETELDKTILEAIKDPLTHIVRNSVDHGIESPEERLAAGKSAGGTLWLRSFHEGGQVNIEISDDGRGLNIDRIKEKAIEKELVTPDQAEGMSERELTKLILLPGFSTAAKVTNVSGRGVGMDVVKTNIEKIGGTLDIQSTPGQGTTLSIKIPLTLAIIPALVVEASSERFAIPQVSLVELVRLEGDRARNGIEQVHNTPVYRLRGKLLPLVRLNEVLGLEPEEQEEESETVNIVVLRADGREFGLVVDAVRDTEEIVVKPLGNLLKETCAYAGTTIMGDGHVALILDVLGLARSADLVSEEGHHTNLDAAGQETEHDAAAETLLVLGIGDQRRIAMPISKVSRLEEIQPDKIETSDNRELVQYRGELLPLIRIGDFFGTGGSREGTEDEAISVVVHSAGERSYGLVVDRIIDIVDTTLNVQYETKSQGLSGTAVISGKVTDLVDLESIITMSTDL